MEHKKSKLTLKGIDESTGIPFIKEIHSLDEVKTSGTYIVIARNATSEENGFPSINGKTDCCFCCEANLVVNCCYNDDESQSSNTYGQELTISDKENNTTGTYKRTVGPAGCSEWLMVATGSIKLVAQNNDIVKAYNEVSANLNAALERIDKAEDTVSKSHNTVLESATVRFHRIEENEATINPGEVDVLKEIVYYKPSNIFVAADSAGAYWDSWDSMDAYMSGGKIRSDKAYLYGGTVYIYDGTKLTDNEIKQSLKTLLGDIFNNVGYLTLSGSIRSDNEDYRCSDYYPLSNSKIIVKNGYTGASSLLVAFYDANKAFISGVNNAKEVEISPEEFPNNAAFVRFSSKLPIDNTIVFIQSINNQALLIDSINKGITENSKKIIDVANGIIEFSSQIIYKNKLRFDVEGYYINNGLNYTENARNTGLIRFTGFNFLTCLSNLSSGAYVVAFFDKNKSLLKEISITSESSGIKTYKIDLSEEKYSNAYYLSVSTYDSEKDFTKYSAVLENPESLERKLTDIVSLNNLDLTQYGYYHLNGTFGATENAMATELIPIEDFERLEYAVAVSTTAAAVCFFDASKQCITELSIAGKGSTLTSGVVDLTNIKYVNVKYIAVSYYDRNQIFTGYKARLYNSTTIEPRLEIVEKITNITPINNGLKVLIFGDSITTCADITTNELHQTTSYSLKENSNSYTNAAGETVKFSMWPALMTKYLSCSDIRNYAQSGASYVDKERDSGNERQNLSYQIQLALNDISNPNGAFPTEGNFLPDIIIFALGTNDGTPNDTYEDAMEKTIMSADGKSFDIEATLDNLVLTNTCEAIRYAFLKIKQSFPNSLCLCILPIQRADKEQPEINKVLEKIAKRYSIKVIDGYSELGILRDLEVKSGLGANLKDGLHPNDMGQKLYTRMIVSAIKNNWINFKS